MQTPTRKINWHLAISILLIIFLVFPRSGTVSEASPGIKPLNIDLDVLVDAADGDADFLVFLSEKASLDELSLQMLPRLERRAAVVNALRQTAARSQASLLLDLQRRGLKYQAFWIENVVALRGSQDLITMLGERSEVDRIVSNRPFRADLPTPYLQPLGISSPEAVEWNIARIGAPELWALGITGQGIVYATADTGVDWDHPALINQYRGWNGSVADHNYNWWDPIEGDLGDGDTTFTDCDEAPCSDGSHGTHVTGIGVGNDGAANQIGVSPGARWIGCRNMENGWGVPSIYIDCLQFLLAPTDLTGANPNSDLGADVVGNSYSCPPAEGCDFNSLRGAVDAMRIAGVFMAVSAGNSGSACSTVDDPPGIYDSSITVGAVDSTDLIAPFSSRGPVTTDGSDRLKPDLVAPGVGVSSSLPGTGYGSMSGTSMAAPHVAGAVALLWSAFPILRGDVDAAELLLEQSAFHPPYTTGFCGGDNSGSIPNHTYGYGRIDVKAAFWMRMTERVYLPITSR